MNNKQVYISDEFLDDTAGIREHLEHYLKTGGLKKMKWIRWEDREGIDQSKYYS